MNSSMDGNGISMIFNNSAHNLSFVEEHAAVRNGITMKSMQEGAAMYIVIVVIVYGMSIVFLISSQIYRRPNKMIEDRQIDKYLKEFQVFKERSSRDSYRHLKTIVAAKLYRQDHMGSHAGSGVGSRQSHRPDGLFRTLSRTVAPLSAAVRMPLDMPRLTLDIALANEWGKKAIEESGSSAAKLKRDDFNQGSRQVKCTCKLYVIEEHPQSADVKDEEIHQLSTGTITPPQCTCELDRRNQKSTRETTGQDSVIRNINTQTIENEYDPNHKMLKKMQKYPTSTIESRNRIQLVTAEISSPRLLDDRQGQLRSQAVRLSPHEPHIYSRSDEKRELLPQKQFYTEPRRQPYIPMSGTLDRILRADQTVASIHENPVGSKNDRKLEHEARHDPTQVGIPSRSHRVTIPEYPSATRSETGGESMKTPTAVSEQFNECTNLPRASFVTKQTNFSRQAMPTTERSTSSNMGVKNYITNETMADDCNAEAPRFSRIVSAPGGAIRGTVAFTESVTKNVKRQPAYSATSESGSGSNRAIPSDSRRGILTTREKTTSPVHVSCV